MSDRPTGPLGVDPLHYVCVVFGLLICWVGYLLLPKGMRQQHFGAYPKRFRWSARPRSKRGSVDGSGSGGIAGRGQVSTMLHGRRRARNKQPRTSCISRPNIGLDGRFLSFFIFPYSSSIIDVVQGPYLSYCNNHSLPKIIHTFHPCPVPPTNTNTRHLEAHRKTITEIYLHRALAAAGLLTAHSNTNHRRAAMAADTVDSNSKWAVVRASKMMRSSYRPPCNNCGSRAF